MVGEKYSIATASHTVFISVSVSFCTTTVGPRVKVCVVNS